MSDDLEKRLRESDGNWALCEEAADELARLRSENEALKGECERLREDATHLDFIESLLDTTEVHIQRSESGGVRVYIDYDLTEIGVGENLRAALKEGAAK